MNVHDGHRGRLRGRYMKEGGKTFAAHNLLELLLFYAIPRKDTNEIAHSLLARFGDVQGVLNASIEELCEIKGVNESTAILIKVSGELGCRYYNKEVSDLMRFYSYDDITTFLTYQYNEVKVEQVHGMFFTGNGKLLRVEKLCDGTVTSVRFKPTHILSIAVSCGAATVVLAHNHPDGVAYPSSEDLTATRELHRALANGGLELLEHYVVADKTVTGILGMSLSYEDGEGEIELKQRFLFE